MPKRPKDFRQLLSALRESISEDADAIFSLPEKDLDAFLAEEGIDPRKTIADVQKMVKSLGLRSEDQGSSSSVPRIFLSHRKHFWTHSSILKLRANNPVDYICEKASRIVLNAIESEGLRPPFDIYALANHLNVDIVPNTNVPEARISPSETGRYRIEFDPNKNKRRVRFSLAHELAHTLFPDCDEAIRHRLARKEQKGDDWQLETLCNLAAAEFLMPVGHFPQLKNEQLSIRRMLELRREYEVSTEAVLLRFVRMTQLPCVVFAASLRSQSRYAIEYAVSSRSWQVSIASGDLIPKDTHLAECTDVGHTTVGDEEWFPELGRVEVQGVRVFPLPDEIVPRVVGFIRPHCDIPSASNKILYLKGDVTNPRGKGHKIVAHVVNDKTPRWGAGVGQTIQKTWPEVQRAFQAWTEEDSSRLKLGNAFFSPVKDSDITVFDMICQHGYGHSSRPRIRYAALRSCLEQLADYAKTSNATIHLPRIGAGQAGGSWQLIEQLVDEVLCARGLSVTVYEWLRDGVKPAQPGLFD